MAGSTLPISRRKVAGSGPTEGEANWQFWQGDSNGTSTVPDFFSFWNAGEPNNLGGEDYAALDAGAWNDLPATATQSFYYVEFADGRVPEPSTFAIVGLGLAGLGVIGRRKKT